MDKIKSLYDLWCERATDKAITLLEEVGLEVTVLHIEGAKDPDEYIKKNGATVRHTAGVFNISKSTVHKDVTERLKIKNPTLYSEVKKVLEINKSERHIRGGMATRKKYKGE